MPTITKDQLRKLQAKRGCVDTDSGKVFVGLVATPVRPDDARQWNATLNVADRIADEKYQTFSLKSLLATETPPAKATIDDSHERKPSSKTPSPPAAAETK